MGLITTMWFSAILLAVAWTAVQCNDDSKEMITQHFDHLKRLAEDAGWKPKIEAPAAELAAIEEEARKYTAPDYGHDLRPKDGCPPGYTGPTCSNPICYNTSTIHFHDGTENMGDDIEWDISAGCNATFYFPLDMYISNMYITIAANGQASPTGTLFSPQGMEITPCEILANKPNQWQAKYCNIVQEKSAGLYSYRLRGAMSATCIYSVKATSPLISDGGFVTDPHDDDVQQLEPQSNNGIERMPLEEMPSYLAFALSRDHFPVQALSVAFYRAGVHLQTSPVITRYHCGAPNFAGTFTCEHLGYYQVKIRGVDADGNIWQRVYFFDCLPSGTVTRPTGTPSTGPPPTLCYNEGQLINANTTQASCYCLPFFTGKQCETKLCFNDGFLSLDGTCVCTSDFSGTYCQDVQCSENINTGPFDLRSRALVFVVRASMSMQPAFQQIVLAAQQVTDYYTTQHVTYFRAFVLVTFVNGTIPVISQFPTASAFIQGLQDIVPGTAGCDDIVFTALATVLQLPVMAQYRRSPIFVFTDGVTNDGQQMAEALFHQLSFWRGQVYTVLTDPANGCNIDTAQFGYRSFLSLARFTQGHLSYVQKSNISSLVFNIAAVLFQMDFVMTNDLMVNCQQAPNFQPFFVDQESEYIIITATGTSLVLSLTDPTLTQKSTTPTFEQNGTYIWRINKPIVGSYLLSINGAQAPCQYRVMARSSLDLFFGTAPNLISDADSPQPIFRTDSHIVAHVNGLGRLTNLDKVHAEVTITSNDDNDNRVALFASNGVVRDQCAYFLYFGAWRCLQPFQQFYITIYATDNVGATFQRTATGFCSAFRPTPSPPNGCLNGGVDGPNGTCICQPHFYGPLCQQIQCLNGATVSSGICLCPPGFSGQFCETIMCYNPNPDRERLFSPNDRSLTYIIHDSLFMRPVIKGLAQSAAMLAQDISQQHPRWIRHYQVITFNDSGYKVYTESSNPNDFVQALNQASMDNQAGTGFSCKNLKIFDSINRALTSISIRRYGYMFVFTNGQALMNYTSLLQTYRMLEASKVQVNFIQTFSRPCGGQLSDPGANVQIEIPAFSGGDFFLMSATKAARINSFVPTLYSGNYVYENYVTDCTAQQNFYFPVYSFISLDCDSHTQAYTIYTYGQLANTGNNLLTPRGDQWSSQNIVNIWNDASMYTRVDQIIRPCDPGWDDVIADGYCYKFNFQQLTWADAQKVCHSEGAVLVTIFDAGFENILEGQAVNVDFWIGLNDIAQEGVFVWDQLNGSLPLTPGMYTKWAPGQPEPDPGHQLNCVIEELAQGAPKGSGWVPINCSLTKSSVCIKKNYNYNYEPSFDIESDIPKGIWTLGVQTQSGPCYVKVYSQSQIQLYHEFVINVHDDVGLEGAVNNANDNRMIAHITHQEASSIGIEGELQYLHIYKENLTLQDVETFTPRAFCAFEYISTPFSCPDLNFNAMVTGIDSMGYLYQRIKPVFCMSGPTQGSCRNGGAFYNGRCYCPQYWTGPNCETAVCINGGTLEPSGALCRCRRGWTGTFCELPVCEPIVPVNHRTNDNRTFVLVLDGSFSSTMAAINVNLQATLTTVLNNIHATFPNWFSQFVCVIFFDPTSLETGRNITSTTITSTTIPDFVAKVVAALQPPFYTGTCSKVTLTGLIQALNSPVIGYRDEVFVLTAATAIDWSLQTTALTAITRTHSYVNFIMLGETPCSATYSDPGWAVFFNLALISGGGFYQITPNSLVAFWSSLMSTFYGSSWLTFSSYQNCANITQYVQIGSNSSTITVDMFGIDPPTLNVLNPNGTRVVPRMLYSGTHSTLDQFIVAGFPGLYTLQVNSGSTTEQGKGCFVKVRGQSQVVSFIGFTQDVGIESGVHSDQVAVAPVKGDYANALVASEKGAGSLTYVQFLSLTDGSLLWSSPLQKRSGCAFPYISKVFTCPAASFAVAIEGTDFEGHPIRRITNIHCVGMPAPTLVPQSTTPSGAPPTSTMTAPPQTTTTKMPPSTTPLPSCSLKNTVADLVVLFDSSSGLDGDEYRSIVIDFIQLSQLTTIGGDFVRVAMGTYDMQSHFYGDFLTFNSSSAYVNQLFSISQGSQTGTYGNNIDGALKDVINLTTSEHGYRTGGNVVDMIVIVSSTGWDQGNGGNGFNDPSETVRALHRAGMNIVPIGIGRNADMQQLLQISPCAQYAPDVKTFDNLLSWLWSRFCLTGQFC